jgi:hypothetical protein
MTGCGGFHTPTRPAPGMSYMGLLLSLVERVPHRRPDAWHRGGTRPSRPTGSVRARHAWMIKITGTTTELPAP